VLLTRSGYTGEQRVAQVVWAGDQEADFSETDGLPTVVSAALTAGLSGIPYFTHDVGGFSGGPRDRELLLRWAELGTLTPVMRTHDGLKKYDNVHFDSDADALQGFARLAQMHEALAPYFLTLVEDAQQRGLPMIRHTALVDPEWPEALDAHAQWMVGPDLVFAPVVKAGQTEVTVRLPAGKWEHLLAGEAYAGRAVHRVAAPLGTPAVFVKTDRRDAEPLRAAVAAVRALR
jgi:alpha-glucosidase